MNRFRLAALVAVVAAGTVSETALAAPAEGAATTRVTVTGGEFFFRLSKRSAPRGTVFFTFINRGTDFHDLKFQGKTPKTRILAPGARQTIRLRFTRPGRYQYLCTVGEHAIRGMRGVFVVR